MQVGAEVRGAAVAAVPRHGPGADLHHVGRPGAEALDPSGASLGGHGVGDGLAGILSRRRTRINAMSPKQHLAPPAHTLLLSS